MTFRSAACAVLALVTATPLLAAANAPTDSLLERASAYVEAFVRDFSTVVADEEYVQDSHPLNDVDVFSGRSFRSTPLHVELRSDYLFVTTGISLRWLTFRDVYSVNGRAVRDREQRLARLFLEPQANAVEQAGRISREGYRYNIGSPDRTVADPLLALGLLQPQYRSRFEYRLAGIDTSLGPDVWIIKFKERVRPSILRTPDNRNAMSAGRFWIDGGSGRVLQTELETSTGDRVMTTFTYDERLQVDVPAEMRDISWSTGNPVTGRAVYTNFRRFAVAATEKFR